MQNASRRRFLSDIGKGMLVASVGASLATDLGLGTVLADEPAGRLNFGQLEPLAALMQSTPPEKLMPLAVEKLNAGTDLKTLIGAAALANARAFGGNDYIGFHTFMALGPAYAMSAEMPADRRALPVLKVIYRNASRIQSVGAHEKDAMHHVEPAELAADVPADQALLAATRSGDMKRAEQTFAAVSKGPAGEAFNHVQMSVEDEVDVHRVVLCWRSWSTLDLTGLEHAQTLLRQSVRYCVDVESKIVSQNRPASPIRTLLPKLMEQHKLLSGSSGNRQADDAWIDRMANLIADSSREQAAEAVAAALAEGFMAADIGEALSLAANQLVLRDPGRPKQWSNAEKPQGSVHGDSVGVHASDAANAWRNIASASNARNAVASLIVGAFHTAGQTGQTNKTWYPAPEHLEKITSTDPAALIKDLGGAIQEKDQFRACALATRYGQLSQDARPVFDVLLKFAASEDGALHAEKYYRTAAEEFARTRAAFRWRQVAALARVTASEYGRPAPGYQQACELLKIS